ncbi:uncharacterized protein VP01_984g8 [Puccinia sorghi]|uniref:Helicase ATP-binding domain-containing protein n=1 Tax=Puccinia sorghi TaxID=27349 RepID=A0A0L6U5L5_9BASI|nr:uncharacterized protein VP01_984g8 [Puccinia sorghi]
MASSYVQAKSRLNHYQPIFHSRYPPSYSSNNPKKPPQEQAAVLMPAPPLGQSNPNAPTVASSVQDRLAKLEASLPAMHEGYQREISALRGEVESLKGLLTPSSKPSLNKNATPFVPGPAPMTPPTPVDFQRPSPLALAFPPNNNHNNNNRVFPSDSDIPSSPAVTPFDLLPPHEQIYSLSQQVNVLSSTISQLLTTLLATSNPSVVPLSLGSSGRMIPAGSGCGLEGTPSSPSAGLFPTSATQIASAGNKALAPQPPPPRRAATHRHPGNLIITPSLPSPLLPPQSNDPTDASQSRPHGHLRLRLFSPTCQTPVSASTPMSPLSCDPSSMNGCGTSPMNSLAGKWEQLGIGGDVLRAIVRFGVGPPSKTQQKSIPNMLLGKDLISQSNPIQERIQSYIIPALQLVMNEANGSSVYQGHNNGVMKCGPAAGGALKSANHINTSVKVLVIAATLDEAAQAHRLARGIAALLPHPPKIVHCGASPSSSVPDVSEPMGMAQHTEPHILIGTPSKLLDPVNGLRGYTFDASSFICVILDEMDQLLARNLSDMVTSLMTFLPPNSSPGGGGLGSSSYPSDQQAILNPSGKHESETCSSSSPCPSISASDEWSSGALRQSPHTSSGSGHEGRMMGRQTCIFSCTVPQDVLIYARSLNLRVKVIVRREENNPNNPASCKDGGGSGMTGMGSKMELVSGEVRTPHLSTFPWTNQTGNGNSSSTHQLLRQLVSQFYYRADQSPLSSSLIPRERKLQALVELLFRKEVAALRAGKGQLVIIYCNSVDSVEVVSRALAQHHIDVIALHQDMGPTMRHSLRNKFGRDSSASSSLSSVDDGRTASCKSMKVLVVYDVLSKTLADISKDQPSIVINFELPRAVEDYIHRAGCIISTMNSSRRASVPGNTNQQQQDAALINLVNAGSEIETIKSIESFYRCKIQELLSC